MGLYYVNPRIGVGNIKVNRPVAQDLAQGGKAVGNDRHTKGRSLDRRQAEPLGERWKEKRAGARKQSRKRRIR
jgi:hypothetical protein